MRIKFLEKYLTLWIALAMIGGIVLGVVFTELPQYIESFSYGSTNILLAIGLIIMMFPPLARVDYSLMGEVFKDIKVLSLSLFLNWIIGPVLMFILAVIFLKQYPDYMVGVILIGLARCIAMVIVWNDLAKGNREYAAVLIALNSLFQLVFYSGFVWLFINVLPAYFNIGNFDLHIDMRQVFSSVLVYLGIPFASGFIAQKYLSKVKGKTWYNTKFIPFISPFTLYALLFTIVVMFTTKANEIVDLPHRVIQVAIPLSIYFVAMFFISFFINKAMGVSYQKNAAISFTASGNNFELAIAVGISVFGLHSAQAFVGVIGPLIEVPVLILLVRVSLWLKAKYYD